jgi:hypothetical protein
LANIGYTLLLVLTAAIWGSGFVAQIEGNAFGPFAFSCIRGDFGEAKATGVKRPRAEV